jgi:hypothetical protein
MTEIQRYNPEKLEKSIKLDGRVSIEEKEALQKAYEEAKEDIFNKSFSKLRQLINEDYGTLVRWLVWEKWIKKAQNILKIDTDGIYWMDTMKAVMKFQKKNWLVVDGIIGPKTLQAIEWKGKNLSSPSVEEPRWQESYNFNTKKAIKDFEKKFPKDKREGLAKVLNIDEKSSSEDFVKAIAKFQKVYGNLEVDGIIWKGTIKALKKSSKEPFHTPMTEEEIDWKNTTLKRAEKSEVRENLSERWKVIFDELFLKVTSKEQQEILEGKVPITLADSKNKKWLYITRNGDIQEFTIIIWQNWVTTGSYVEWDRKTPIKMVHRFNRVIIAQNPNGSANNDWTSHTVLWASIQSDLSQAYGWRYFHGVWNGRDAGWGKTFWCVWLPIPIARKIAFDVQKAWNRGFWYVA